MPFILCETDFYVTSKTDESKLWNSNSIIIPCILVSLVNVYVDKNKKSTGNLLLKMCIITQLNW